MDPAPQPPARALDAQFWSDLGLKYEEAYGQDAGLVQIVQKWLSFLPPSSTVMECGCGTGVPIARTIADSGGGHHYHGIDIAEGMVSLCQKQVPGGTYQVVNMLDFVPKNIQYDGIVASFSHFELSPEQHAQMARNWFSWIKPGGYLLLSTITGGAAFDFQSPGSQVDPESGCAANVENVFLGNRILVTVYTRDGWTKLIKDAGFEIVIQSEDMFRPVAEGAPEEPRFYIIARKSK